MYVIAGATGQTGAAAADALLAQGKPVTVIVHSEDKGKNWQLKGAKVAVADLGDTPGLRSILSGADGAYLLIPPGYNAPKIVEDRRRVIEALAKAVAESGISHVVLLSSIGGHLSSGTGLIVNNYNGEKALAPVAKNLTVLRASYFIENWRPVLDLAKEGVLPSFLIANRKIPMVATKDVGRVVAESLVNPARGRRVIELAGPQDYSPDDIAQALRSVLGREVSVNQLPVEAAAPILKGMGFSDDAVRLFQEMSAGINSGHVSFESKGTEFRRGNVTPEEVFRGLLKR